MDSNIDIDRTIQKYIDDTKLIKLMTDDLKERKKELVHQHKVILEYLISHGLTELSSAFGKVKVKEQKKKVIID